MGPHDAQNRDPLIVGSNLKGIRVTAKLLPVHMKFCDWPCGGVLARGLFS